ncbi:MAG TPA: hypothetical protein VGL97_21900 [Bryobacteraceae bacterium]
MRRGELLALSVACIQLREEHWVIADLHGKAGHIRTVPIPLWSKRRSTGGLKQVESRTAACLEQSTNQERFGVRT